MSFNRWLNKKDAVHRYSGYYSVVKNDRILLSMAVWMDLESIVLSEIRQKRTRTAWSHSRVEYKTKGNKGTNKSANSYRQQNDYYQKRSAWRENEGGKGDKYMVTEATRL